MYRIKNVLVQILLCSLTMLLTIVSITWRILFEIHGSDKLNFMEDIMFHLDQVEQYICQSYYDTQTKVSIEDYKLYLQHKD